MPRFGRRDRDYVAHLSHALFGDDNTGPGRSGGEFQNSVATYHTPRSEGDFHSKTHDRQYAQAMSELDLENADYEYAHNQFRNPDLKYKLAGAAVGAQGVARTVKRHFLDIAYSPFDTPVVRPAKSRRQKMADAVSKATEDVSEPLAFGAKAAASGSGSSQKGSETQIQQLPKHIAFGIPKVFTCKHRYFEVFNYSLTSTGASSLTDNSKDMKIRLNSVYDVVASSAGTQSPTWRTWAETYWNHYTVLGCDVTVRMYGSDEADTLANTYHLLTREYASITPTTTALDKWDLMLDPSVQCNTLVIDSTKSIRGYMATFHKFYTYADYDALREVNQDSTDNIWTDKGADPALTWQLWVMPRPEITQTQNPRTYRIELEMDITAQWRELNETYKFSYA